MEENKQREVEVAIGRGLENFWCSQLMQIVDLYREEGDGTELLSATFPKIFIYFISSSLFLLSSFTFEKKKPMNYKFSSQTFIVVLIWSM